MNEEELPPELDLSFYRARNPDLASLSDDALFAHYRDHGSGEGRCASPAAEREGFLDIIAREHGRILEVGPFARPLITGGKVRYLDFAGTDRLRAEARVAGLDPAAVPRIHYVGKVDALPRSFDAAVACRSIGHHPDLVGHLQSIARVLIEGGRYYLIVPDRRFTGAAGVPATTVAALIAAHRDARPVHSLESVIAHRALRDDPASPSSSTEARAARIAAAIEEHDRAPGYVDLEAWRFTPESFRELAALLHRLGLSPLNPVRVWTTPSGRDEFCAVLEKA